MARYYHIATMGCQMNEYDSDYIGQLLQNSGFLAAQRPEEADLFLINTCSVRDKAEQKAYSLLGRVVILKKKKPSMIIGFIGCLAQQAGKGLIKRFPDLDFVLGTREIGRVIEIVKEIENGKIRKKVETDLSHPTTRNLQKNSYFQGDITGFIAIMEGCNNFCSYCIVPYVRGRETSRSPEEIKEEVRLLVQQGVKDITLLGQNVNSYQYNGMEQDGFSSLIRDLKDIEGLLRVRFTTSHPKDLSPDLVSLFGEVENLCPHIHLPFQSGSDTILKRMNRGYSSSKYMELISSLRKIQPEIAITSDVIVGFPGETESDFEMTLDLIKKIEFDNLFSFKYSDRQGTLADKMGCKIEESIKSRRLAVLQDLQKEITLKKNKRLEGKIMEILIDGTSKKGEGVSGRTGTNKVVNIETDLDIIGQLVQVKIKQAFFNSLRGEIIR